MEEALPDRAARHRPGHRLLHVSDVERLSGLLRRARHGQRRHRQAASGGDPAAGDHGEDRARSAGRERLRPERRHAGRARCRRRRRAEAGAAARSPAHRLHRQHRQRRLAGGRTRARRRCTPRRRGSTRSSSTPRTISRAWRATSRSRSSLYTGQMCTAPQNIYVPRDGIDTAAGTSTFDQVAAALAETVQKLPADPAAVECWRRGQRRRRCRVWRGRRLRRVVARHAGAGAPGVPSARVRTPLSSSSPPPMSKILPNGSARSPS